MSDRKRTKGDDYPIVLTFRVNGIAVDLTGSVVKFSYINNDTDADQTIQTITGTPTVNDGEASFTPDKVTDFKVAGIFTYDVQRVDNENFTFTHQKGTLIIDDDVTV